MRLRLIVWGRNSPSGGGSPIGGTASPAPPSAAVVDGNGLWARGPGKTRPPSSLQPCSFASRSSLAFLPMSCLEMWVTVPEFFKTALPGPRPFASIGVLSSLRLLQRAKGTHLRRFPPSLALLHGRYRQLPRFENRGRPVPRSSPSAPMPMGSRFRGPSLGEIDSPKSRGIPRMANCCGIGDPTDAAGLGGGISNPAPSPLLHRPER